MCILYLWHCETCGYLSFQECYINEITQYGSFASAVYPSGMVLFVCSLVALCSVQRFTSPTKDGTHGPAVEAES